MGQEDSILGVWVLSHHLVTCQLLPPLHQETWLGWLRQRVPRVEVTWAPHVAPQPHQGHPQHAGLGGVHLAGDREKPIPLTEKHFRWGFVQKRKYLTFFVNGREENWCSWCCWSRCSRAGCCCCHYRLSPPPRDNWTDPWILDIGKLKTIILWFQPVHIRNSILEWLHECPSRFLSHFWTWTLVRMKVSAFCT